ncbi:MAG TPA: nucleotide exchange factor GrpE [Jatrophihabitans sp.]|nr:nucleotide exchange factor GrpE [Jatrophihabitans sp.]
MSEKSSEADGGAKPPSGFTFADKRKISPDGTPRAAEPVADEVAEVEPEPDMNERLAAERLADLQRLQAEYANYRKRVERDRALAREATVAAVVESLLPVLDDIHLARQHGDLESGPFASVADKLETILGKYGLERFGEPGAAFDPAVHDALLHVDEELAPDTDVTTVVGILQPGYRIGDKVIRPARVSVADPS